MAYECPSDIISRLARQPDGVLYGQLMQDNPFLDSWWNNRVKMGKYPMNMGLAPKHTIAGRFAGPESIEWGQVLPSNGTGSNADNAIAGLPNGTDPTNPCCPPMHQLEQGFEDKTVELSQAGVYSYPLCYNDLITAYDPEQRLGMAFKQYGAQLEGIKTSKARNDYIRFSTTKVSYTPGSGEFNVAQVDTVGDRTASSADPAQLGDYLGINDLPVPTSELDESLTTLFAEWLTINGVKGYTQQDGAEVYELVTSMAAGNKLIRNDPNVRRDFNYADMGKGEQAQLMKGLGARTLYRNFIHQYDKYPLRFWHNGEKYINIPARKLVATTNGYTMKVNQDWLRAPYELSVIYNDEVIELSVPDYNRAPGGQTKFGLNGYAGQLFFFLDPLNPAQNSGRFYSYMQYGTKPLLQYPGIVIMHLNCNRTKFRDCNGTETYYQQTYGA